MLDGLKIANPELDVIEDTVVVRKDKNNRALHLYLEEEVVMNLHMRVT